MNLYYFSVLLYNFFRGYSTLAPQAAGRGYPLASLREALVGAVRPCQGRIIDTILRIYQVN